MKSLAVQDYPKSNYKAESFYFDWLMMGGVQGVTNVISRGFEISPTMIELLNIGERFIPKDRLSGHTFLHDFGQGWWENDYEKALTRLNLNMQQTVEKYQYLGRKTDSILMSDVAVALVYHGTADDDQWRNLLQTLFDRYKKWMPIINLIELDQNPSPLQGVYTAFIDDAHSPKNGSPEAWEGWDDSWYSGFSSLRCIKSDGDGFN